MIHAAPIEFMGVNLLQTRAETVEVLAGKNFECISDKDGRGNPRFVCVNQETNAKVRFIPGEGAPETVMFDCGAFNGCDVKNEKMAQAIAERYGLSMEWTTNVTVLGESGYCGDGKEGDKICTLPGFTTPGGSVMLFRNKLGNNKKLDF